MKQATDRDNLDYLIERIYDANLSKSQRMINGIAIEYGLDPNSTKVMATARIALIYSKDKDKIKIGDLLFSPLKNGLTDEQKQKAIAHIMHQLKKALKQIDIQDSEVDLSSLSEKQQQMLQSVMQEIEKENDENVCGYNYDNAEGLVQKVISSYRNINAIDKDNLKKVKRKIEEEIQKKIQTEISKKHQKLLGTKEHERSTRTNNDLDYLRVPQSELQTMRKLIEESGHEITEDTLLFIKCIENEAYPEEMKMMQDIDDVEELEDLYNYYLSELTIARNNDWYIIYGEDEDSIEIVDIASLPMRYKSASQEIYNYITGVINRKAHNANKHVTLDAKKDTSYRMIQRMVSNGEYEILEDATSTWEDNDEIVMHNLVLKPILERKI